jgi:hypothetical protein
MPVCLRELWFWVDVSVFLLKVGRGERLFAHAEWSQFVVGQQVSGHFYGTVAIKKPAVSDLVVDQRAAGFLFPASGEA